MDSTNKSLVCRLCLRRGLPLIDIFEENIEHRFLIKEAIEDLLHFKVHKRQGLPWIICPICCAKLDDFRYFKNQCLLSSNKFNQQEDLFEEQPPSDMIGIVDVKSESTEVEEKFPPQVTYMNSIQADQDETMMTDDRASIEMDSMICNSERDITEPKGCITTEGCGAEFWRGTEAALEITVPKYLKNILKLNGCDNGLSMAEFDAVTQIPLLEKFVREDIPSIIPLDCFREDYYGIFERCPEQFRIVSGHVHILVKMAEFWKEARKPPKILQRKNEYPLFEDVSFNSLTWKVSKLKL